MGQINTIVALMVQVPLESEGSDGNPEVALGYDVSDDIFESSIRRSDCFSFVSFCSWEAVCSAVGITKV